MGLLRPRSYSCTNALGYEYVRDDDTAASQLRSAMAREHVAAGISSMSGVLAVLIASIGLYGALAYAVTRRTSEIAVRRALGASRASIFHVIASEGLRVIVGGVAIGLGSALVLTRYLEGLLFGITPGDPRTFVTVALLFFAVAGVACSIPARRATRIDPMVVLRHE